MKALTFTLNCVEPLLISQLNVGDPNSAVGRNYIPGSTLRGSIVDRFLRGGSVSAESDQFRHLFLDGSVCFLNAYPLSTNGRRMLPTPLTWQVEKGEETSLIRNLAIMNQRPAQGTQWVGAQPFCSVWKSDEGKWKAELCQPKRASNVHTFRTDRQRSSKDSTNTVFRYEALQAGQRIAGAIISQNGEYLEILRKQLAGTTGRCSLHLGKSRNVGYGQVYVENLNIDPNWTEIQEYAEDMQDVICITFLSDTVVRDSKTGCHKTNLDDLAESACIIERSHIQPIICSGFNRVRRLPLPQVWGIQAGSVLVYPFKKEILHKFKACEEMGIGERRAEGFGRIAIQWNLMDEIQQEPHHSQNTQHTKLERSDSKILAQRTVDRIYRTQLNVWFVKKLLQLSITSTTPSRSQLSGLRQVLRNSFHTMNGKIIIEYMKKMRPKTQQSFKIAKIDGNQSFYDWIVDLATNPSRVWEILGMQNRNVASIGGITSNITDKLALEYAIRLIDGVLQKMLKEGGD